MSRLDELLAHIGYSTRPQQVALYERLIGTDERGVIVQAGTGVGKSLAVLSAAAHAVLDVGHRQALVVTPTLVLMQQYMAADVPAAAECFGLDVAELRGKAHYFCQQSATQAAFLTGVEYERGCWGEDADCTTSDWMGTETASEAYEHAALGTEPNWECGYQSAKAAARAAQIVVTNSDFFIINDRLMARNGAEIFALECPVYIDEAHQFEPKLRDWASRSLSKQRLRRLPAAEVLLDFMGTGDREIVVEPGSGEARALASALAVVLSARPTSGNDAKKRRETYESLAEILKRVETPNPACIVHIDDEGPRRSLKTSWINVAASAGQLLTTRPFALVSATVPGSMASSLGVPDAPFFDVGHPFNYREQATLGMSPYDGSYRYAQSPDNMEKRSLEIRDEILAAGGGALVLSSAFRDLTIVRKTIQGALTDAGITVLWQGMTEPDTQAYDGERVVPNDELSERFKADGNAVLFGSASFATGFDVKGDALRLVVLFKLPYPGMSAVNKAIMQMYPQRYRDAMLTTAAQGIGRLIRTETDRGRVWIADSRGRQLLESRSPMVEHLADFARA